MPIARKGNAEYTAELFLKTHDYIPALFPILMITGLDSVITSLL